MISDLSVSIIIPNWNGVNLLQKNLPFIIKARKNKNNNIKEIIVVDDGSTDDSVQFLKKYYPDSINIIKHSKNRGFPAAINTGARASSGSLICLLNSDVIVTQENFLEAVLKLFKDKNTFAVSLHELGFGPSKGEFVDGFISHKPGSEMLKVQKTFWVSGGSGVFNRSIWMDIGGMDEKIFSPYYWEDLDICYRALKRGYKLFWNDKALVVHEHETTIKKINLSKRNLIIERNQLLFIWKNLTSQNLFKKHIRGLLSRLKKHPGYFRIVFLAILKIKYVLKVRRKEIKESTISDEAIFASFN